MQSVNLLFAAGLFFAALGVQAQAPAPSAALASQPQASTADAPQLKTDGEVRKVDKDAGKLTLRHGPIQNLEMPAMTMVFKVANPLMLENLKEGDKVRFTADRVNGAITVTSIETTK